MNAWVLALLPAVIGVDYGWERKPDGSIVYIIQVEPEAVESMKTGAELVGALPPELRNITNYKIRLGREVLPNQNQLPPEISSRSVVPPPSAFPAPTSTTPLGTMQPFANAQPLSAGQPPLGGQPQGSPGFNATSNYQTPPNYPSQPGYTNQPGYMNQPNYTGAPVTSPLAGSAGGQPTSTSGFEMKPAGSFGNPTGYNGQPNYTQPNYTQPNYTQPNYTQPNPTASNWQPGQPQPTGTNGYVWNPATNSLVPAPGFATLPTGSTTPSNWTASGTPGTQPTYGAGGVQPGYQSPPALNPATGQNAWVSNGTPGYGQPSATGVPGPVFPGSPEYQNVGRQPLEGPQPQGFVNSNTTGVPGNPATMPLQNRPGEPASPSPNTANAAANAAATPAPEKSWGLPVALVMLFASIGFNMWCGWTTYNLRERYRSLLSERAPAY